MNLEVSLKKLREVGLTLMEEEMPILTDEPKIPGFLSSPNQRANKRYTIEEDPFGQGFDTNSRLSRIKSVGECLERLCLYNPIESKFVHKKRFAKIDPKSFFCYSSQQINDKEKYLKKLKDANFFFYECRNLFLDETVLIPAQLIFLSNHFQNELPIRREQISTGAALGSAETDMAFLSGFLEVIERDSCISAYLKRNINKEIIKFEEPLENLINYFRRYALEPHVFDVTTDLRVPSILAITLDSSGVGNAINVGSKSALSYEQAIKYALLESIQCRRVSRTTQKFKEKRIPQEDEILSMDARFLYWHPKERIRDILPLLEMSVKVPFSQVKDRFLTAKEAVENVKNKGYNIFIANITLPEIAQNGFEVIKVLIPEMHPLYLDERAKSLYSVHHGEIQDDPRLKPHFIT